jgi:hypothetical protein
MEGMRSRLFLIGSVGALALAVGNAVFHWILYTDALVRRFLSL